MNDYKCFKDQLNSLHRKQYDKKRQLARVSQNVGSIHRYLNRNKVVDSVGRVYVDWGQAQYLSKHYKSISKLQKEINQNIHDMKVIQSYMDYAEKLSIRLSLFLKNGKLDRELFFSKMSEARQAAMVFQGDYDTVINRVE